MNKLIISNKEEFGQLLNIIQSEKFNLTDIKYNENYKVLEIPYRRIFHEGPSRKIKDRIIYSEVEVDVLRCMLRIRNVKKYEITDKADIGIYSFSNLKIKSSHILPHLFQSKL